MATYATPEDVALNLRGTTDLVGNESALWQAWLDRVERSIERAFQRAGFDLTASVAGGIPRSEDVADVEIAAVIRRIQNPNPQQTSVTRSIDDAQVTYRNEAGYTGDPLELTEDELLSLIPRGGDKAPRVFSVMPL